MPESQTTRSETKSGFSLGELCRAMPAGESGFWLKELAWHGFYEDPENPGRLIPRLMDPLISECNRLYGGFDGAEILELGPFEGAHTVNLHRFSPARVTAIEANPFNYIKCLIVKEHYELANARILLGNFVKYLEAGASRFDFILTAGVLYHLAEPFQVLDLILNLTTAIGICTTVYVEGDSPFRMTGQTREVCHDGAEPFRLYERTNTLETRGRKHGIDDNAWLFSEADLLRFLKFRGWEYEVFPYIRRPQLGPRTRLFAKRSSSLPNTALHGRM